MSLSKYATKIEALIATHAVDNALKEGCAVSVYDGEEMTVKRSNDRQIVLDALATTESDMVHFHRNGVYLGWVHLVWGNDCDLISDYNENIEWLIAPSNKFAETF
jgi:hypothetical protein